ncbi:cytochrome P450, partial [Tanacetum coccineum]
MDHKPTIGLGPLIRLTKFSSLRLIDPINGVRGCVTQRRKSRGHSKNHNTLSQQPISDPLSDTMAISDSYSKIQRFNIRILSKPQNSTRSESNEVANTIHVGNQIGFNMNGKEQVVSQLKKSWIKRLCIEQKVKFAGFQETMARDINRTHVQSIWNHTQFDFVHKMSQGKSGGILAVWDTSCFIKIDSLEGDGFLAIIGKWYTINSHCLLVIVYAPQDYKEKKMLWKALTLLINRHNSFSIILSDFNEVRHESEHRVTVFDPRGASKFNDFIASSGLCDLPIG